MKWITVSNKNYVCEVTLNRPEVRNAFDPEMITEITQTFQTIPESARVVVLRGAGEVFCSGADLEWMKSMVHYSFDENKNDSLKLYGMFKAMEECRVPVVAMVQGAAMGGALGLMAVTDVVIAVDSAKFCFSEVKLGLVPAVISSFVLQKSSLGLISPWMIAGKVFGAHEAQRMGLVHEVAAVEKVEEILSSWIKNFLEAAPEAVKETKALVSHVLELEKEQRKDKTIALIAARRVSAEGQEGLKAFLEKRAPAWKTLLGKESKR